MNNNLDTVSLMIPQNHLHRNPQVWIEVRKTIKEQKTLSK